MQDSSLLNWLAFAFCLSQLGARPYSAQCEFGKSLKEVTVPADWTERDCKDCADVSSVQVNATCKEHNMPSLSLVLIGSGMISWSRGQDRRINFQSGKYLLYLTAEVLNKTAVLTCPKAFCFPLAMTIIHAVSS